MTLRRIGFHVSVEGGLPKAVGRALERRCTALQVFCGSPRGWSLRRRTPAEIAQFVHARLQADLRPLAVHACYLVNPAASSRTVFARSVSRLSAELELAAAMGADFYVLHPGSHRELAAEWGVRRAAEAISRALSGAADPPMILLENTASAHGPGGQPSTLGQVMRQVQERVPGARLGVAVDSCHAFGAGYDLRDPSEVDRLAADVDRFVGLAALRLLHVNDSRDEAGARRDRHEHIGKGRIGLDGLRNFLNHPALAALPLVLETPWQSAAVDRRNLRAVLGLLVGR